VVRAACGGEHSMAKHLAPVRAAAGGTNVELSGRGLNTNKLCMIKIYVKADTPESRSVVPDQLQRHVM